jgi:hypothetical protein
MTPRTFWHRPAGADFRFARRRRIMRIVSLPTDSISGGEAVFRNRAVGKEDV